MCFGLFEFMDFFLAPKLFGCKCLLKKYQLLEKQLTFPLSLY